ncbi:hypothetical protein H9P43_005876 [Blastocladiella emersonii ATCC 22665]|nr:hypothetical protein H9P43_005876 [Blastocladiella emersonii ATCC 22665]
MKHLLATVVAALFCLAALTSAAPARTQHPSFALDETRHWSTSTVIKSAAIPPPAKIEGFVLNRKGEVPADGGVQVTAFLDPLCPDSAAVWPALGDASAELADRAVFRAVLFPLPYHRNAFILSQAAHAWHAALSNDVDDSPVKPLLDLYFSSIDELGSRTDAVSELEYRARLVGILRERLPALADRIPVDQFKAALAPQSPADTAARRHFKHAAYHGVTGTPQVLVNGVLDPRADEIESVSAWRAYLDGLGGR